MFTLDNWIAQILLNGIVLPIVLIWTVDYFQKQWKTNFNWWMFFLKKSVSIKYCSSSILLIQYVCIIIYISISSIQTMYFKLLNYFFFNFNKTHQHLEFYDVSKLFPLPFGIRHNNISLLYPNIMMCTSENGRVFFNSGQHTAWCMKGSSGSPPPR